MHTFYIEYALLMFINHSNIVMELNVGIEGIVLVCGCIYGCDNVWNFMWFSVKGRFGKVKVYISC